MLMSFLLNLTVVGFAVWTLTNHEAVVAFVRRGVPGFRLPVEETTVAPSSPSDVRQAVELPHYPAVHIVPPSVSVFDPAA